MAENLRRLHVGYKLELSGPYYGQIWPVLEGGESQLVRVQRGLVEIIAVEVVGHVEFRLQ